VLAASIRQRLRDGDFQVGDRVFVAVVSDVMHRDTLVVRTGRVLELPGKITVPLTGVLRSELKDRVTEEVMKYVRAREIEVTPLTRLGVLGEVARPGFFAFASDTPIADAIMGAGGPTPLADIQRSVIRRGSKILRSSEETRTAIATGLTLDQFGINAGDELVIGKQREFNTTTVVSVVGVVASVLTIFVALRH
jgi:polysaccharide export outer membrane protein